MKRKQREFDPVLRSLLKAGAVAGGLALVFGPGILFTGCGSSSGSSGGYVPPPGGGGGGTTTTAAAAINSQAGAGNVTRTSTSNGNKITRVTYGGSVVQGDDIVYTVNGVRDDGTRPEDKQVQTGDVIDLFDLLNGSRVSIVVVV